jgi:hypothetical protein
MPAEWEPHEATWLGWPHELTDWPGKFAPIPWAFAEIVRHLSQVERVYLLVENREAESRVRNILKKSGANLSAVDFPVYPPIAVGCATQAPSAHRILLASCLHPLALQRLGQVRQSQRKMPSSFPRPTKIEAPPLAPAMRTGRRVVPGAGALTSTAAASAHNRRMPPQPKRRAQSRIRARGLRRKSSKLSRRRNVLWLKWHRRRRHPRPRHDDPGKICRSTTVRFTVVENDSNDATTPRSRKISPS